MDVSPVQGADEEECQKGAEDCASSSLKGIQIELDISVTVDGRKVDFSIKTKIPLFCNGDDVQWLIVRPNSAGIPTYQGRPLINEIALVASVMVGHIRFAQQMGHLTEINMHLGPAAATKVANTQYASPNHKAYLFLANTAINIPI
ncbi:hypothetical protein FIE12Z_1190 [Fusarium flagelliforme]|uniref:Uncharacterized protein n=1 Tax=Fusarium flagelliforme TaxID=2675880 RepID=A0A395N3H6_9HYPO|nr:hypothetical protein FIE12Z_1190 [Fusarium flagelliforme]